MQIELEWMRTQGSSKKEKYLACDIYDLLNLCMCLSIIDNHCPSGSQSFGIATVQIGENLYRLDVMNRYNFVARCQELNIDLSSDSIIDLMDAWFASVESELQPVAA